ncbi:MAG: hypothetical protein ACKOOL_00045 [Novosphingobium sp.]
MANVQKAPSRVVGAAILLLFPWLVAIAIKVWVDKSLEYGPHDVVVSFRERGLVHAGKGFYESVVLPYGWTPTLAAIVAGTYLFCGFFTFEVFRKR